MEPTTKFDGFVCIDCGKTSFAIHNAPVCTGCRHREAIRRMDYSLIRATVTVCAFERTCRLPGGLRP